MDKTINPQLMLQTFQKLKTDPSLAESSAGQEMTRRLKAGKFNDTMSQYGLELTPEGIRLGNGEKVSDFTQLPVRHLNEYKKDVLIEQGEPVALSPNRVEPTVAGQIARAPLNLLGRVAANFRAAGDFAAGKDYMEATNPIYTKLTGDVTPIGVAGEREINQMKAEGIKPTASDQLRTGAKDFVDFLGAGAEAASYTLGGEAVAGVGKAALKTAGKEIIEQGAKQIGKELIKQTTKQGLISGAAGGFGIEAQNEDATLGSILTQTALGGATGAGAGAATTAGIPLLASGIKKAGSSVMNKLGKVTGLVKDILGEKIISATTPQARQAMAGELVRQGIKEPQMNVVLNAIDGEKQITKAVTNADGTVSNVVEKVKNNNLDDFKAMYEHARKGNTYAKYTDRATDVVGKNVVKRIDHVISIIKQAGAKLDDVAQGLVGKEIDYTPIVQKFNTTIEKIGGKKVITDKGFQVDFTGSDFEGVKPVENAINSVYARLNNGQLDGAGLHRLKRFIRNQVDYGKETGGLTGQAETILKGLAKDVDGLLDSNFPEYKTVNDVYAQSKQAVDMMKQILGKQYQNLDQGLKESKVGDVMRRILGNGDRTRVAQALKNLEDYSQKTGLVDGKDIVDQVIFSEVLGDIFGTEATTGLQGQVQKAITATQDMQSGNLLNAAGKFVSEKAGKLIRVNQERKDAAIRALLGLEATVEKEKLSPLQKVTRVAGGLAVGIGVKKAIDK